jgi:transcriptional regulator GlxA family with amidase domain
VTITRIKVGILIFDDVEVLDFCGPFEVFSIVRLNEEKRMEEPSPFDVVLVAEHTGPVLTAGGMQVTPGYSIENCPPLDILLVPGGMGTRREMNNGPLLEWLKERSGQVEVLASVCTGSLLLGKAGLLDGRRATTHWATLDWMKGLFPDAIVEHSLRVVEDGNVYTSAGVSAGIDLALLIVARYFGEAVARAAAVRMEYPYPDDLKRRVPV